MLLSRTPRIYASASGAYVLCARLHKLARVLRQCCHHITAEVSAAGSPRSLQKCGRIGYPVARSLYALRCPAAAAARDVVAQESAATPAYRYYASGSSLQIKWPIQHGAAVAYKRGRPAASADNKKKNVRAIVAAAGGAAGATKPRTLLHQEIAELPRRVSPAGEYRTSARRRVRFFFPPRTAATVARERETERQNIRRHLCPYPCVRAQPRACEGADRQCERDEAIL